jgi:hypothetical protein
MRKHKLYLRPEKCEFKKTRIEYLGVIISHNKVKMDPVKVARVADWPTPTNKKEVQFFVRFINFYRRFISDFSHHARALFDLTMKDVRFIWGLPQEDSFMKLKELITSSPVLVLPNDDLPFRLEADGSGIATGAVLFQQLRDDNATRKDRQEVARSALVKEIESKRATLMWRAAPGFLQWNCAICKGTSIHFLTSYILSHSPPVHMYSPSSPLHYSQGPYP